MKTIDTKGITSIQPIPGAAGDWYYGMDYLHGDLYEVEECFRNGEAVYGRELCLIHYPDGQVFIPVPKQEGHYSDSPVFLGGSVFIPDVDFIEGWVRIFRFDCADFHTEVSAELPLSDLKDCYNLRLDISPLTLTRQCAGTNEFEILWPEKRSFPMEDHESFFLRDGDRLFFNRWQEEGEGKSYRYWEETVVKDLNGNILEILPGDVMRMPNGEIWHFGG